MKSQTLLKRAEIYVSAATIASHASANEFGFRQRDVRFFTELFSNWTEADRELEPPIQNTQIQRYLDDLLEEGFLRRVSRQKRPSYRLTRVGLLELLSRLVESRTPYRAEHFLFLVFFVGGYRDRLEALVKSEGAQFPPAARIELAALLDVEELISQELRKVEIRLQKINVRIDDAKRTRELVQGRLQNKVAFEEIVHEVEKKIPYELNSRKPFSELISSIQPDQRRWELLTGNQLRVRAIWEPQRALLKSYREELIRLRGALAL